MTRMKPFHPSTSAASYTAFAGHRCIAAGPLEDVARRIAARTRRGTDEPLLVFADVDGAQTDLDPRVVAALARTPAREALPAPPDAPAARSPGRPRLGVVAREVTLLPRHWEWLSAQPGGASVALRKLVDEARRTRAGQDAIRAAQERAYRFLQAIAGNLPRYEEALRALFAGREHDFVETMKGWPADVRAHARRLADGAWAT